MHRALAIEEILGTIFSHSLENADRFRLAGQRDDSDIDLARVARTCTRFYGPASDLLWRSTKLGHLLRCLPSDLWTLEKSQKRSFHASLYTLHFSRPILPSDWDRVVFHGARVRHLVASPLDYNLNAVLPVLELVPPPDIFPNLRSLQWDYLKHDFRYLRLFLNPGLTSISLATIPHSQLQLLATIAQKCKTLDSIRIDLDCRQEDANDPRYRAVSGFVCQLQRAESLSVHMLDEAATEHISRLPDLTSLVLQTFPATFSLSRTAGTPTFATLRDLSVGYPQVAPTTHFLQLFSQVPLESLELTFSAYPTAAETDDFYSALAAGCAHSSLTTIYVDADNNDDDMDSREYRVLSTTLRKLFVFTNLTSVFIKTGLGFALDDASVWDMARSWPRIEHLSLMHQQSSPWEKWDAGLESLQSFALHCPHLKLLALSFNATLHTPEAAVGPLRHCLAELDVQFSPISSSSSQPRVVADFLASIFPALRTVHASWDFDEDEEDSDEEMAMEVDVGRRMAITSMQEGWRKVASLLAKRK